MAAEAEMEALKNHTSASEEQPNVAAVAPGRHSASHLNLARFSQEPMWFKLFQIPNSCGFKDLDGTPNERDHVLQQP